MTSNSRLLLLLPAVLATYAKYIFVDEKETWDEARARCQTEYTDLAPISNEYDRDFLHILSPENKQDIWIGLMRNPNNCDEWLWSGGGSVNKSFWRDGEPNNHNGNEEKGLITGGKFWKDDVKSKETYFFCYKVHVVRERKTWEEALDHCREHHKDLASVASDTELMLIQKELDKSLISERVWIGLRFLDGRWQWVDGQPLEYEAWGRGEAPECPNRGCAALLVEGTPHTVNASEKTGVVSVLDVRKWNPLKCQRKCPFICY